MNLSPDLVMNVSHPHQCDKCQFSTKYSSSLGKHKLRAHPDPRQSSRRKSQKRPWSQALAPSRMSSSEALKKQKLHVIR